MDVVILCEFPSDNADARSWILGRVAMLAIEGKAELNFVGTEEPACGRAATETIAIRIASPGRANAILSVWRAGGVCSGPVGKKGARAGSGRGACARRSSSQAHAQC